jgi:hypothetical protein
MSRRAASLVIAFALLDLTAVGVQLPTLRADLGSSPSGGQWILNSWLLALAVALVLARALPARRATLVGAVALAAGSIVCATAGSTAALVTGRAIAGAGVGALLAPVTSTALLLPALALAFGPVIGGEAAGHNWWHLWFWAGVPGAAVMAATALRDQPGSAEAPAPPRRTDVVLLALVAAAVIVLVQNESWGLVSRSAVEALGVASMALLATRLPSPERAGLIAVAGGLAAFFFLLPQYLELAHLIKPLESGARLSVLTVAFVAGAVIGRRVAAIFDRPVLGFALASIPLVGFAILSTVDPHTGTVALGAGLVCAGGGLGLGVGATPAGRLQDLIAAAAPAAALMLAASGAVFQQVEADQRAAAASFQDALSQGVGDAIGALILLVVAVIAIGLVSARPASSAARPAAES